jgi:hypothetical protein
MSNISTADELRLVLEEAESASASHDAATAERLAQGVLASGLATALDQARASVVIAAAILQGGSPDAAWSYLQGLDTAGDATLAERVRVLQAEIEHYNDQLAAGSDGVESGEVAAIVQAAEEALDVSDGARAEQLLLPAYQSGGLTIQQAGEVAVLLARATLMQGRPYDAEQYAGYAASVGATGAAEVQQSVRSAIDAARATADGTDATEATAVFERGRESMFNGDAHTAATLFASVYSSDSAPGAVRARAAFNAAVAHAALGNDATARQWLEEASSAGMDSGKVQNLTARLDRREQALDLVD